MCFVFYAELLMKLTKVTNNYEYLHITLVYMTRHTYVINEMGEGLSSHFL